MRKNKTKQTVIVVVAIFLIAVIAGAIYMAKHQKMVAMVPVENVNSKNGAEQPSKEFCYYKETKGTESTDLQFTSINYGAGDTVSGVINFIPGEKDSLVGSYTGTLEANNGMTGFPLRAHILYTASGEGIVNKQEQYIAIGHNSIESATDGDKYQDKDGVWKFKDVSKISYGNSLPLVDCATVPANASKDYTPQ